MYKLSHRNFGCLHNILDAIEKIQAYTNSFNNADEFSNSNIAFDATMMNFIVIGEMVEKLSDDFIQDNQIETGWHKVRAFRNILAHNYFGIDAEEVWQIIVTKLPLLKIEIEHLLEIK